MGCPALELAGRWVELGLSVETEISGRALTDWYYVGLGGLWWSNVLNSAPPPQRLRPDTQPEHQDPVSHTAVVPLGLGKLACSGSLSALHIRITCFFLLLCQRQCSTEKYSSLENSHSSEMALFFHLWLVGFHLLTVGHVQRPLTWVVRPQFLVRNGCCQCVIWNLNFHKWDYNSRCEKIGIRKNAVALIIHIALSLFSHVLYY